MQTVEVSDSQSNIQIVEISAPVLFTVHVSKRVNETFFFFITSEIITEPLNAQGNIIIPIF